jgi:serine/threonine-protein kinase
MDLVKTDQATASEGADIFRRVVDFHPRCVAEGVGTLHPGEVLDERFVITEVVSRSGMSMIFRAQDLHNGNADVALKVPHMAFESDPGFSTRFQREEEIGLSLNHPYILRFIPITTPKSRPYIVMEYLRGCTLAHLMSAMSPIPEKDALKIGALLCQALEYLHGEGVTHRDLKPHNVMVGRDGTIRLLDFGLAKSTDLRRVTFCGFTPAMGTPDYMAPEQVKGRRGDARTDIYSLGAMLYEMLTGKPAFDGDSPLAVMNARVLGDPEPLRSLNPAVSPQAEEIVLHAMERQPSMRQPSAQALGDELSNSAGVALTGRCDRVVDVAPARAAFHLHFWSILAFGVPVVVPVTFALWLFLFHGVH